MSQTKHYVDGITPLKGILLLVTLVIAMLIPRVGAAQGKHIYWTTNEHIFRAARDGSQQETLYSRREAGSPHFLADIAVDVEGGKIYWTSQGGIQRADLDGENVEDLVTGLSASDLALDVAGGKMYWVYPAFTSKIQRADLNGENVEDLITDYYGESGPLGIALDVEGGKIYWADNIYFRRKIQRADLDGGNVEDLDIPTWYVEGIALDEPAPSRRDRR